MEFNVLSRAKILSPQSKHKSSQTTNQTVNVILPQPQPQPPEVTNPVETDKPIYPIHEPSEFLHGSDPRVGYASIMAIDG